jgi:hypothetical protein
MKKAIFLLTFCSIVVASYSQDTVLNRSYRIGFSAGLGIGQPIRFEKSTEITNFYGKATNSFNLNFSKFFPNHNALQIGFTYSQYKVEITTDEQNGMPPISPHNESFNIISIPISYNKYFQNLFYIGFGTILDFELPGNSEWIITDKQSGLGLMIEGGKEFRIKRVTINISPNLQLHSFAPFVTVDQQQRMLVAKINIGINYNLK